MKIGTVVKRINKDNYPDAEVGDIGVVVKVDEKLLKSFGSLCERPDLVLVDFGKGGTINILEHIQEVSK